MCWGVNQGFTPSQIKEIVDMSPLEKSFYAKSIEFKNEQITKSQKKGKKGR